MKFSSFLLFLCIPFVGCVSRHQHASLTSIQIFDRNGFKQTITSPDRLKMHQRIDFSKPQPYTKVVRIYSCDKDGKTPSRLTTYHPNGGIWEYLEVVNGRANGIYREWHPNGNLHLQLTVIEGLGELSSEAQMSWVFDGTCLVWDEQGSLKAKFNYEKGLMQGVALYYFPSGQLEQQISYEKGEIDGDALIYSSKGELIGKRTFVRGKQQGIAMFKGDSSCPPYTELYREGLLIEGSYYDFLGKIASRIEGGFGEKATFLEGHLYKLEECRSGILEGEIKIFDKQGFLANSFFLKGGKKQGEEWVYYPALDKKAKLCINWVDDKIHGLSRTWFLSGKLESEREMYENQKHGVASAWYADGTLRLVEEYQKDQLVSGKYFQRGSSEPFSSVEKGKGSATLYDSEGLFLRKICYENGHPILENP